MLSPLPGTVLATGGGVAAFATAVIRITGAKRTITDDRLTIFIVANALYLKLIFSIAKLQDAGQSKSVI
jgi:hypothetical protein